ncbi:MAG: hypothetical protein GQ470_02565 [Gammaproteobacteria bacterium]|nr:hypothetical protein [Gammaproteobacteria bacterium]
MRNQQGFSLIETVMFIVIVGIAVSSMSQLFIANVVHSHEPLLRQKSITVASAYMDEIINKRWNENSPVGGTACLNTGSSTSTCTGAAPAAIGADGTEIRASYDDIDDYHNLSDSPPQYPDDASGELPMTGYSTNFTVTIQVTQPPGAPVTLWNSIDVRDVRKIVVTIDNSVTGESLSLTAYRFNF